MSSVLADGLDERARRESSVRGLTRPEQRMVTIVVAHFPAGDSHAGLETVWNEVGERLIQISNVAASHGATIETLDQDRGVLLFVGDRGDELSAARAALRAAQELQRGRLATRIGIDGGLCTLGSASTGWSMAVGSARRGAVACAARASEGAILLGERTSKLLRDDVPVHGELASSAGTLRRDSDCWTLSSHGVEVCLLDSKGMRALASLLARPHVEIHALELCGLAFSSDPGAIERARVNVTRTLRAVVDRIALGDPELGRHFECSVRTGKYCSYSPPHGELSEWIVITDPGPAHADR
jgi:hypothetical protein